MKNRYKSNALILPGRYTKSTWILETGSEDGNRFMTYRKWLLSSQSHERDGFTHVEFLPVMEHPFYGPGISDHWLFCTYAGTAPPGFHVSGRSASPNGIGVILDWVPSHFRTTSMAGLLDGTYLYEHADPQRDFIRLEDLYLQPWRNEVRNFLISSALFWLDRYHVDGLRVDAWLYALPRLCKESRRVDTNTYGEGKIRSHQLSQRFNEAVYEDHLIPDDRRRIDCLAHGFETTYVEDWALA